MSLLNSAIPLTFFPNGPSPKIPTIILTFLPSGNTEERIVINPVLSNIFSEEKTLFYFFYSKISKKQDNHYGERGQVQKVILDIFLEKRVF